MSSLPAAPPLVLVCDDEPVLRALVRASLADTYEIVEAGDGATALLVALDRPPDLIVLDMMMPGKTGLEVLADLRADERLAATPVIMLTARAQTADREAAASAGADRYLSKPFSPAELAAAVDELIGAPA